MTQAEPRAVSVGILKGGFGKTTTSINLGRELAERGHRTLITDLDDNGHLTLSLGFQLAYEGRWWAEHDSGFWAADGTNHMKDVLIDGADPRQFTLEIVDGLDLFPAHEDFETVQDKLKNARMGTTRLKKHLVDPLLGDDYDYIVVDCPPSSGKLNENAMFGTRNLIIPLRPETGYESGLTNTVKELVEEAREFFDMRILAVHPTDLQERIDQETRDRRLLRELTTRESVAKRVPNFAYLSPDDWGAIDEGTYEGELPGIRHRSAIDTNLPARDVDPTCDQLQHYQELAQIVEQGEVHR